MIVSYIEGSLIKYENYLETNIVIYRLVTELWIITLASTHILYLLYGHNFGKSNRSTQRAQKEK